MKTANALEYIEDCRKENGELDIRELAYLVIWAYDQGWVDGRNDLREEQYEIDQRIIG